MRAAADRVTTIGRLISFRNSNSRATRRRRRRRKRIRNKRERAMDGADLTTPTPMPTDMHHASTRPTLAFPLGTTLLLIVIFCLSGIFSCCYHWEKLRLLRQRLNHRSSSSSNDRQPQLPVTATPIGFAAAGNRDPRLLQLQQYPMIPLVPPLPSKVTTKHQDPEEGDELSSLVIMPGDHVPKFIAWPCPSESSLHNASILTVGMVLIPSASRFTEPANY